MARAAVRVVFGLVIGCTAMAAAPVSPALAPASAMEARCATLITFTPASTTPAGTGEPWSLPQRDQPDPDHPYRRCDHRSSGPKVLQPLWEGPAWGVPFLGSFV